MFFLRMAPPASPMIRSRPWNLMKASARTPSRGQRGDDPHASGLAGVPDLPSRSMHSGSMAGFGLHRAVSKGHCGGYPRQNEGCWCARPSSNGDPCEVNVAPVLKSSHVDCACGALPAASLSVRSGSAYERRRGAFITRKAG